MCILHGSPTYSYIKSINFKFILVVPVFWYRMWHLFLFSGMHAIVDVPFSSVKHYITRKRQGEGDT